MTFWQDLHFFITGTCFELRAESDPSLSSHLAFKTVEWVPFPQLQVANNEKDIQGGDTIFLQQKQQQQQEQTELKATQRWSLMGAEEKHCQAAGGWQTAWPSLEGFLEIQAERCKTGGDLGDRRESGRGWGRKAQWLARAWGLGRKLGWTHWWRGAAVQMENDTNNNVGRIPDEGLKEHLAK